MTATAPARADAPRQPSSLGLLRRHIVAQFRYVVRVPVALFFTIIFPLIILMTDGVATEPDPDPEAAAMAEATLCKNAGIRILTVSLGLGADQDLMQDIADETGGIHFNVPGGGTIASYEQQLMDVFQNIAADRPLKLLPPE